MSGQWCAVCRRMIPSGSGHGHYTKFATLEPHVHEIFERVRDRHLELEGGHWFVIGHGELQDLENELLGVRR